MLNSFAARQADDNPTNTCDKSTRKFLVDGSTITISDILKDV